MSNMMAVGRNCCAKANPVSPCKATIPLKPCSRPVSSKIRAKLTSSSTISNVRSPGSIVPRSSLKEGLEAVSGWSLGGDGGMGGV